MYFELWHLNQGLKSQKLLCVDYCTDHSDRSDTFGRLLWTCGDHRRKAILVHWSRGVDEIIASETFIIIPPPVILEVVNPFVSVHVDQSQSSDRFYWLPERMKYNQSFFNFLRMQDPAVIYVNKKQNQLPDTPTNRGGVDQIKNGWLRLSVNPFY